MEKLISCQEVADYLGVSRSEVHKRHWKWARDYGIDVIRMNGKPLGKIRFKKSQIEKMVNMWREQ